MRAGVGRSDSRRSRQQRVAWGEASATARPQPQGRIGHWRRARVSERQLAPAHAGSVRRAHRIPGVPRSPSLALHPRLCARAGCAGCRSPPSLPAFQLNCSSKSSPVRGSGLPVSRECSRGAVGSHRARLPMYRAPSIASEMERHGDDEAPLFFAPQRVANPVLPGSRRGLPLRGRHTDVEARRAGPSGSRLRSSADSGS
jgi:hypothetical protein